VWTHLKG
jgi:hypothetical protein